jgi:hypothetical protein
MTVGSLAQRIAELGELALQGDAGGVVARRFTRAGGVAGEEHALAGAQGPVGVASELKAQAAQAAAVVVGLVDRHPDLSHICVSLCPFVLVRC